MLCGATQRLPNRVARALKLAAQGLHRSQSAMGAFYRRIAARESAGKAITATAHKLARHVYAMLTHGEAYVQQSQTKYEAQFRDRSLRNLQRRAASLGFQLQPLAPSSA